MPHTLQYPSEEATNICPLPKEKTANTEHPRAELVDHVINIYIFIFIFFTQRIITNFIYPSKA